MRKIFRFTSSGDGEDLGPDGKRLAKRGENVGKAEESRVEKARRKAEEKRLARLEREMLEEEERKQREEMAKLVEERRRLRDEKAGLRRGPKALPLLGRRMLGGRQRGGGRRGGRKRTRGPAKAIQIVRTLIEDWAAKVIGSETSTERVTWTSVRVISLITLKLTIIVIRQWRAEQSTLAV